MRRMLSSCLVLLGCSFLGVPSCEGLSAPATSWQRRLDAALLDIDATPSERLTNFREAVRDPLLRTDVASAFDAVRTEGFGKGHPAFINALWPEGTIARADLEGLTALKTQVPEALRELRQQRGSSSSKKQQPSNRKTKKSSSAVPSFADLPTPQDIREELKNAFRATPTGLETPSYSVVRVIDGAIKLGTPEKIEFRRYDAFTVATTPAKGGAGFNTLATYLFGGNEEEEAMAMTMPVFMTDSNKGDMQFVLPASNTDAPPTPLPDEDVQIRTIPARLVAVQSFPGLVTDEEVVRQKAALLAALADANVPGDADQTSVLQYNSPLTIPWRRRNEIAIVLLEKQTSGDITIAAEEAGGVGDDAFHKWNTRTSATSWYDAGVRL